MDVLVVADHSALRDSIAPLARDALAPDRISHQSSVTGAIAELRRRRRIELVLLDLAVSGSTGIEALTRLRDSFPRCRIVVFSSKNDERGLIISALHAGAAGYLSRRCGRKVRIAALCLVADGGIYLPPEVLPEHIRVPVTPRQREVLRLMLKGYGNQRIASELGISESTVKQHAHALFDAMGVSSRAQLIATAARRGIHVD